MLPAIRNALKAALPATLLLGTCVSSHAQKTIHVPADRPTIQTAIDASVSGDTVLVSPGTYNENIDFHGHSVTVTSEQGPGSTVLDGGRLASTVKFVSNETRAATLAGFTIRNGQPANGAQIGGGIYIAGASPTVQNNILEGNYCTGIAVQAGGPLLRGNIISATHGATGCTYPGTAIILYGTPQTGVYALVDSNTLSGNLEETYGALLVNSSEDQLVQNNVIRDNAAMSPAACAAGACILNTVSTTFFGNEFVNNSTAGTSARALYAGILQLVPGGSGDQLPFGAYQLRLLNNTFITRAVATTTIPEVLLDEVNARTLFLNNVIATSSGDGLRCTLNPSLTDGPPDVEYNGVFSLQLSFAPACHADATHHDALDGSVYLDSKGNYVPLNSGDLGNNSVLPQPATDFYGNPRVASQAAPARIDLGAFEEVENAFAPQSKILIAPSRFETGSGQAVVINAALVNSGALDVNGTVLDLYLDGAAVQQVNISSPGTAQFAPLMLTPGVHDIYASTHFITPTVPGTDSVHIHINGTTGPSTKAGGSLVLTVDSVFVRGGNPANLTLSLAGNTTPGGGAFRLFDNGVLLQSITADNSSILHYSLQPTEGEHLLSADYQGTFASSAVASIELASAPPTIYTLSSLPSPSDYGQSVVVGGSVQPYDSSLAGSLRITEGSAVILDSPLDTAGSTSVSTASLAPGLHTFTGVFSLKGVAADTLTITQTVRAAPTTLALNASPASALLGSSIQLTATISSPYMGASPTGTVTFSTGAITLGTGSVVGGVATLKSTALPLGVNAVVATYSGDTAFQAGTSAAVSVMIFAMDPADFVVTSPPTLTVQTQHQGTITVTITSLAGFLGVIHLSCGSLPAYATCTFQPAALSINGFGTVTATLTIETSALRGYHAAAVSPVSFGRRHLGVLACAFLLPFGMLLAPGARRSIRPALLLLILAALFGDITACSSKYPGSTPPGSYTLNITGSSYVPDSSITATRNAAVQFVVTP